MIQTMGRYQIQGELGRGAMAVVYKAYDPELKRNIALKVLRAERCSNADVRRRFLREAKAAGKLGHGNIVTIFDVGEEQDRPFIAMELLDGKFIDSMLRAGESFTWQQILDIATQLAEALDLAHRGGIIHRDIKPANIVWLPREQKIKITDFGIAHVDNLSQSEATQVGQFVGTPQYMSPEQITGRPVDARSDLFSLGVVLYQLLARQRPFAGDTIAALTYQIAHQTPRPLSEMVGAVPNAFTKIVDRLLSKEPSDRFQSAHDLYSALKALRIGAVPSSGACVVWKRIVPASVVIFALAVAAVLLTQRAPSPRAPRVAQDEADIQTPSQPQRRVGLQADVDAMLAKYSCAHLEADFGANNALTIRGHMRDEDLAALMDAVDQVADLRNVTYEIDALAWPYCEVAALLARSNPGFSRNPSRMAINAQSLYREGEPVTFDIGAASDAAYIYADMYRADGSVVHVYPESKSAPQARAAGAAISVGRAPNAWRVQPPLGDAMLVVMALRMPLDQIDAQSPEPAQGYLARLHRALNNGATLIDGEYRMITTQPK